MAATFLVRHAQASFGTSDYDRLSALGIEQARLAGKFLAATAGPIARIVSGPLERQRHTAAEIAAALRMSTEYAPEITVDPRLDELRLDEHIARIAPSLDDPTGELASDLAHSKISSRSYQKVIRRVFAKWQTLPEEATTESWPAFAARARGAICDITSRASSGTSTIAVSSGALIASIVHHVLGLPDGAVYGLFEAMRNCSITQLLHSRDRISLSSFNDTTYLAAMGMARSLPNLVTYR